MANENRIYRQFIFEQNTCFLRKYREETKQILTVMHNFECMRIIFMVVHNFNGGSQPIRWIITSILGDPH